MSKEVILECSGGGRRGSGARFGVAETGARILRGGVDFDERAGKTSWKEGGSDEKNGMGGRCVEVRGGKKSRRLGRKK